MHPLLLETRSGGSASLSSKLALHFLNLFMQKPKGTVSDVPVDAMKAYRGSRGIAPLILNLGTK
jgi:hypothetical protein